MNGFDESKWARWGGKTCTVFLWGMAIGTLIFVGATAFELLRSPSGASGIVSTWTVGEMTVKLSAIADPATRATLFVVVLFEVLLALAAVGLGLFRLRRLLRVVEVGQAFTFQAVVDLVFLGNLLLAAAFAVPLAQDVLAWLVQFASAGLDSKYQLTPDLALLLCGFVVRAVATVFAHGVRLETEAELTV
jgi:hypothetical protein